MELLSNLGINAKLVLAQIVNFFILFYVLKKFAYGPILKILEQRSDRIEKGLKDAEKSSKKLKEIEEQEKKVITVAKKEAQRIITAAEQSALTVKKDIEDASRLKVEEMLQDARKKIEEDKNKMVGEVKKEISELLILAVEKIIGEKLDANKDKELIKKTINELE